MCAVHGIIAKKTNHSYFAVMIPYRVHSMSIPWPAERRTNTGFEHTKTALFGGGFHLCRLYGIPLGFLVILANQISHQRADSNDRDYVEYGDKNTVSIQCHVCHPGSSLSQVSFYGSIISYGPDLCKYRIYALRCREPRISSNAPGCSSTACTYRSGILEQFSMPKSVTGRKPKRL